MSQITSPSTSRPIAETDEAETFAESDLSLSQTGTAVNSGDLQIQQGTVTIPVIELTNKSDTFNSSSFTTVASANVTLTGDTTVQYSFDALSTALDNGTMRLRDTTRGNTIDKITYGEGFGVDTSGSQNVVTSGTETITLAIQIKGGQTDYNATVSKKGPLQKAEATIEWSKPQDVFRWDAVTFQRRGDVTVDIQHNDGSGWTTAKTDIDPGEEIEARPTDRVRFRVQLQKVDTGTSALDSIYRRWIVGPTE